MKLAMPTSSIPNLKFNGSVVQTNSLSQKSSADRRLLGLKKEYYISLRLCKIILNDLIGDLLAECFLFMIYNGVWIGLK